MIRALFFIHIARAVEISTSIPGTNPTSTGGIGGFVDNFYQFSLMIGGLLAFAVIVYGGVKYMTSSGNPSGQGDAKEWIEAALLGLLLLVGAYFILKVVNPQLTSLNLPAVTPVNLQNNNPAASDCGGGSLDSTCTCTAPQTRGQSQTNVGQGKVQTTYYCK